MTFKNNRGELRISFENPTPGELTFESLGVTKTSADIDSGFIRIVFEMRQIKEDDLYKMPKIEIVYNESVAESRWVCEFNGEKLVDKIDHSGKATVLLLNRSKLENLIQHHENKLILHAEFSEEIELDLEKSNVVLFK